MCGERTSGIGRYGFTPHFYYDENKNNKIFNFFSLIRNLFDGEIWIENANFYSDTVVDAQKTYSFLSKLASKIDAGIILDLTHILIDASNLRCGSLQLIKEIDFSRVREVHLSGLFIDQDGIYHDGHSQAVAPEVWSLLDLIERDLPGECWINLEHTDPIFAEKKDMYMADFNHLQQWLNRANKNHKNLKLNPEVYAKKYIKKILLRQIKNLDEFIAQKDLQLEEEIEQWWKERRTHIDGMVIDQEEVSFFMPNKVTHLASDFLSYLRRGVGNL